MWTLRSRFFLHFCIWLCKVCAGASGRGCQTSKHACVRAVKIHKLLVFSLWPGHELFSFLVSKFEIGHTYCRPRSLSSRIYSDSRAARFGEEKKSNLNFSDQNCNLRFKMWFITIYWMSCRFDVVVLTNPGSFWFRLCYIEQGNVHTNCLKRCVCYRFMLFAVQYLAWSTD